MVEMAPNERILGPTAGWVAIPTVRVVLYSAFKTFNFKNMRKQIWYGPAHNSPTDGTHFCKWAHALWTLLTCIHFASTTILPGPFLPTLMSTLCKIFWFNYISLYILFILIYFMFFLVKFNIHILIYINLLVSF